MLAPVSMPLAWLDEDVAAVREAADLLHIQEFAFFRLAHRRWHGRGVPDRELEPAFLAYLSRGRVPPWVRHLAREVNERGGEDALATQEYGIAPVAPPAAVVRRRRRRLAQLAGPCVRCVLAALLALVA